MPLEKVSKMKISSSRQLNIRQHADAALRAIGSRDVKLYQPCERSWSDLCQDARSIKDGARSLAAKLEGDAAVEHATEIEDAFNGLMEVYDAIEKERDRRNKLGYKDAWPGGRDPRRPVGDDIDGDDDDDDDGQFSSRSEPAGGNREARTNVLTPNLRMVDWQRHQNSNAQSRLPDLGSYLRSMVLGAKNETERRALMEGSDSAGGYTVPDRLSAELIDRMRGMSVVNRVGAVTVPLTSNKHTIAKIVDDPEPQFRGEGDEVHESGVTFGPVVFAPKMLAVMVRVTRELLEDSLNIGTALPDLLAKKMAEKLDRVAFLGSGTDSEPRGVINFQNLTDTTGFAAGAPKVMSDYLPFVRARTALRQVNADVSAYVMGVREEGALAEFKDTTGQPLQPPKLIADVPMYSTNDIPSNSGPGNNESVIIAGDWRKLMIGMRNEITIEVLRERYASTMEVGFLCWMRFDIAAEHEQAFTVLRNIIPDGYEVAAPAG
ncbi:phage major capsid protein [Neorhizobium sp. T786]|uniref:phage major capsid protein n=1 Tax=Pseudorhizobium xiangyangii TaxID=2883104 RepID=UPI001CFF9BE3|nr:phage major capsid protein [Neorhizobium xiangyangii]MCB5201815.1 phage major capsid protein [Neorhizobium xiangyangii]